jgi:hypothetical protein
LGLESGQSPDGHPCRPDSRLKKLWLYHLAQNQIQATRDSTPLAAGRASGTRADILALLQAQFAKAESKPKILLHKHLNGFLCCLYTKYITCEIFLY